MRLPLRLIFSIPLLIILINPTPTSAHFFPNITAIPSSLIPNTTIWAAFSNLVGCKKGQKADGLPKLKEYFQYFGYLNTSYSDFSDEFDDSLEIAVKTYQLNFNLNATGQIDAETIKRIVVPRCGNPDIVNGTSAMHPGKPSANSTIHTVAHYSFFPNRPRWPPSKSQLTYAFLPENQLSDVVKTVFSRAFERWSEVTTLTFTEISSFNRADIRIGFFSREHGDGEPFDGVLGTLAHAFSPPTGRCHFDGEENWVIDGDFLNGAPLSAVDLESVAVHEIGHILGLGHSSVEEAIMYPSISSGTRKVELADDDIMGIQELYGSNPNYNGSVSSLTPTGERETSGASRVDYWLWERGVLLVVGFINLSIIIHLDFFT
ncbi:metalloendoproteinase 2-MMP [Sesamum indicum]|uniref:Metalloendoproteinase 2-MMP n=1 Tax=Sesamum indicum TaxID=4182 RepID=A0A6I9SM75_SESIN|nr:metalloendoproteinase 2-MMP [Sesamum indicum]